jgi:uncharacterized membrane protein
MVITAALVFVILLLFGRLVALFACRIEQFWQVVSDLVVGFGTDPGFGHDCAAESVEGWAAVAAPDGWTAENTDRLRDFLKPLR